MTPHEHQARFRANLLSSYSNADSLLKSKEEKPLESKKDEKKDGEVVDNKESGAGEAEVK